MHHTDTGDPRERRSYVQDFTNFSQPDPAKPTSKLGSPNVPFSDIDRNLQVEMAMRNGIAGHCSHSRTAPHAHEPQTRTRWHARGNGGGGGRKGEERRKTEETTRSRSAAATRRRADEAKWVNCCSRWLHYDTSRRPLTTPAGIETTRNYARPRTSRGWQAAPRSLEQTRLSRRGRVNALSRNTENPEESCRRRHRPKL